MKETPFSIAVKKALINFGGRKTFDWNLADINIGEDAMSFAVKTKCFDGFFSVASVEGKDSIAVTYCTNTELNFFTNKSDFMDFMANRTVVLPIHEIAKFVSQKVEVIGHRAPQCSAMPNCGA